MEKAVASDNDFANSTVTAQLELAFTRQPELLGLGIGALAKRLCTSRRTLQRRLGEEGMTFSAVEARVRARLAEQLLSEPKLSIEQVSERLGFTDRRSFTQAFTRWFGLPPSHMRRGLSFGAVSGALMGTPAS
jgi:AraC-like DNA-binding protein